MTSGEGSLRVVMVGVSHRRAPISLRESLAFPEADLDRALTALRAYVPEGVVLSTCHRVELYAVAPHEQRTAATLKRFWSDDRGVPASEFEPLVYALTGQKAVRHLLAVASGLDSAIVGEPQILGQVRQALDRAVAQRAAGPVLTALFHRAVATGRRARTETAIGRNAASVSYAAAELARHQFGDLHGSRVLLIGAGKMGAIAAKNLIERGVAEIAMVGRGERRAHALALECGRAVTAARLEDALLVCDIVMSCTSAPHYVLTKETLMRAMKERRGRPLLLIDIAVPRDIEPSAAEIGGVRLFNIDDLEAAVAANVRARRAETRLVTPIIEQEATAFERWLATRRVVPTIMALRERAEAIRQSELARTAAVLDRLPEADRRRIEALTLAIEKKLLHHPIALLRAQAGSGDGHETEEALLRLFGLRAGDRFDTAQPGPRPDGHADGSS